jgi:hypothetical protein
MASRRSLQIRRLNIGALLFGDAVSWLPIWRREVVRRSDPGGEAHRLSLCVRLPSLVPSREEAVALHLREHVILSGCTVPRP